MLNTKNLTQTSDWYSFFLNLEPVNLHLNLWVCQYVKMIYVIYDFVGLIKKLTQAL